jgi:hypothetical protein
MEVRRELRDVKIWGGGEIGEGGREGGRGREKKRP